MKVKLISDLHFGHKRSIEFDNRLRGNILNCSTIEEHDAILNDRIKSSLNKRDHLWVLGDVGNLGTTFELFSTIKCAQIVFLPGNHDSMSTITKLSEAPKVKLTGMVKKKGYWITHCPIHPNELFGNINIHGHVHGNIIRDDNYLSVCVESCEGYPVWMEDIRHGRYSQNLILDKFTKL